MDKNAFLHSGQERARLAIKKQAERDIKKIEASDLTDQEKKIGIKQIEAKRDAELVKIKDPRILWGNR